MYKLLKKANTYCLYLLVFSITFENWDPFNLVGTLSITYMASILYILSWLPFLKSNLNFWILKKYIVPLILFIIVGLISTAFNSSHLLEMKEAYNYRVLLLIILMYLMANHINNEVNLSNRILNIYIASIILMFFLYLIGVGISYEQGRLLIFEENPNILGMKSVIALLIVIGRFIENKFSFEQLMITILVSIATITLILASGSRAAFLSIFIGVTFLILFKKMSTLKKIVALTAGTLASIFFFLTALQSNAVLQERLIRSVDKGDIGRNDLWKGALMVIENNLTIGVGFPGLLPEMYKYIGRYMDPHNVFLYVLMSTGLIGFTFFMIFIYRLSKSLIKSFKDTGDIIPIVIFLIILINMAKAGGAIGMILFWFFFAVLIGSTFYSEKNSSESINISDNQIN